MIRLGILLAACLAWAEAMAQTAPGPDEIRLTLEFEPLPETLFDGEMVMLTIKGAYRLPITLERLEQPDLAGFDWMQLGEDRWFNTLVDGQSVVNLERRMALFPVRDGTLEIGAFTHHLTLLSASGRRFEFGAQSNELTLDVAPKPESAWWFPARALEVSDVWSNPPERLARGQGVLRVVTVTAQGVEPELIPPMPDLTGAGAHIFPHPERRIVTLGPLGPITRAFWRWTIRPEAESAGYLDPVQIAYFDTVAREAKQITLSAQRVGYRGSGRAAPQVGVAERQSTTPGTETATREQAPEPAGSFSLSAEAGLAAGLFAGLIGLILWAVSGRWHLAASPPLQGLRAWLRSHKDRRALSLALSRDDAAAALAADRRLRQAGQKSRLPDEIRRRFARTIFARGSAPAHTFTKPN